MCRLNRNDRQANKYEKGDKKEHEVLETVSNDSNEENLLESVQETDSDVIWLTPKINGVPLKMELDTGSAVSIIFYKYHDKMLLSN